MSNRWPDYLESPTAQQMRDRSMPFPEADFAAMCDLFDQMEREIRVHRKTFCEDPSRTHTPSPQVNLVAGEPVISAAKRIFELFCGGPVDWSRHGLNDAEDNVFASADWAQAMLYAKAAIGGAPANHVVGGSALIKRMSLALDDLSPEDTIGFSNGVQWIEVATVEEIRKAAIMPAEPLARGQFLLTEDGEFNGNEQPDPDARSYPAEMTEEICDILSLMMWNTGPMAHALRDGGEDIPRKAEAEQAHVMHWLIGLALQYGAGWRAKASDRIREIQASVKAAASEGL